MLGFRHLRYISKPDYKPQEYLRDCLCWQAFPIAFSQSLMHGFGSCASAVLGGSPVVLLCQIVIECQVGSVFVFSRFVMEHYLISVPVCDGVLCDLCP